MQKAQNGIFYSASALVNFLECEDLTAVELQNLD